MNRIAIIGLAGRFPGASTVDEFWDLLRGGRCAVETLSTQELRSSGVSSDDLTNPRYVRSVAALDQYDAFDAERFGYSPREAKILDPQQRVFLETCLTALEDAGVAPHAGSARISVFGGGGGNLRSYANALGLDGDTASLTHVSTDKDFLATRVSFELGLTGPSMSVQTSTSSSLVAVHLACRSLLDDECDVALAGGVAIRFPHRVGYLFQEGGVLSADGVCRPLSSDANGTVFGNGAGVVVLKRLDRALADRDRIRAVVLGSAIGHDGGAKDSYVISSAEGVARVAGQALSRAGVDPQTIGLVEAHATGTIVGDPIELAGLSKAYRHRPGEGRTGIGSVKGNVGHLEAAAGITSLIKAVLSLENQLKPKTLGVTTPNPALGTEECPFRVLQDAEPWAAGASPRRAAVSSLGLGGTNAAVIVEEAPAEARVDAKVDRPWHLLTLSAPTETALGRQAKRVATDLREHPERSIGDACYTANVGRSPLAYRLAVAASSSTAMAAALELGSPWPTDVDPRSPVLVSGRPASPPVIAFLFSGQGQQRLGMARELFETLPSFRATIMACDALMRRRVGRSVVDILYGTDEAAFQRPSNLQPIFFSVQYALAKMLVGWGVTPSVATGHSFGEFAASCVAEAFSLEDAMDLVLARGQLLERGTGEPLMATVFAPGERVHRAVARFSATVGIAAQNSNEEWVISGEASDVETIGRELESEGVRFRKFGIGFAGHSPALDRILDDLEAAAQGATYNRNLRFPIVSTLTGRLAEDGDLRSPAYWRSHTRNMVRAASAVQELYDFGANVFIEIGPSPTFLSAAMDVGAERGLENVVGLPILSRKQPDWRRLLETLGALYVRGVDVDWKAFDRDFDRRKVSFPTYAFDRQTFNLALEGEGEVRSLRGSVGAGASSPGSLGRRIESPVDRESIYEREVQDGGVAILDVPLVSLRFFVELALDAAAENGARPVVLSDVSFLEPLVVQGDKHRLVQTVVRPHAVHPNLEISSTAGANEERTFHCKASFQSGDTLRKVPPVDLASARAAAKGERDGATVYRGLEELGFRVQGGAQVVSRLWGEASRAVVEVSHDTSALAASPRLAAALEAAWHGLLAIVKWEDDRVWLPLGFESLEVHPQGADANDGAWLATIEMQAVSTEGERTVTADIAVTDANGRRVASLTGYCLREVGRSALVPHGRELSEWSYEVAWEVQDAQVASAPSLGLGPELSRWIVLGDDSFATDVAAKIDANGGTAVLVDDAAKLSGEALRTTHGLINLLPATLATTDALDVALKRACQSTVETVDRLVQSGTLAGATSPRLLVVTRGGQPVLGSLMEPHQALAWGMTRTLQAAHPTLRCLNVDLDPHAADRGLSALIEAIATTNDETQVAFRHDRRHVARLVRSAPSRRRLAIPGDIFRAVSRLTGQIDNVVLVPARREAPVPGQVEIAARAHGLSFRDLLTVLGVPGAKGAIGLECAGIVTAVGAADSRFAVGDAVMALSPTHLGSHVLADERLVAAIPPALSFEQAATIPLAFVVAWHLVHDVARVKAGQTVLVHAASGAVGQAIVQVASAAGARVLATASLTKQRALRALEIEPVFSSRTHDFGAEVLAHTNGDGVDAVFHSLQPRFLATSGQCLKSDGILVDLSVGSTAEDDPSASMQRYVHFDLLQAIEEMPDQLGETLQRVTRAISVGGITPIASKTFAIRDLVTALHRLGSPKHSGKVIIASEVKPLSSLAPRGEAFDPLGTYVVAGGPVGERAALAARLRQAGAGDVISIGMASALASEPSSADDIRVDTSNVDGVVEAVSVALRRHPRIRGILLLQQFAPASAGSEDWATLSARFVEAATFAHAIDQATRNLRLPLDFFFFFSSVASIIGIPGATFESILASYVDGLAHARRASGLSATAIDWGGASTESTDGSARPSHWARGRVGALAPSRAFGAMTSMLADPPTHAAILAIRWEDTAHRQPSLRGQLFLNRLFMESADPRRRKDEVGRIAAELRGAPVAERLHRLTEFVEACVVRALGLRASQRLDPRVGFRELGLDSLLAVELRKQLQESLELRLPQGVTFNHPNVASLAEFLAGKVFATAPTPIRAFTGRIAPLDFQKPVEIAIVGISARFPGAHTLKEFGEFLAAGGDAITAPSAERLALWERGRGGTTIESSLPTKGGYIDWPIDRFDNEYFRTSLREAKSMDPRQRLLLELSVEALEHAGVPPQSLRGSLTGVFYGMSSEDFSEVSYRAGNRSRVDTYAYTGNALSVAAGRVSYALDFRGPNVALDTACSSSLVAIHQARMALAAGECDVALAGGVNLILSDAATTGLHRLNALSPDGHCWSFDARANGFARAEGGGVLVLKRLDDALAAGDTVHAVLLGGAVNHGGAAAGLTAPNGAAQAALLRAALRSARILPNRIDYLEAHGTGTPLGDPIEVGAIAEVFSGKRARPLLLTSVKSNVGHLEAAAGVCGLIRMILALERDEVPPQANLETLNPALELEAIPAQIPREGRLWPRPANGRRIGGISSFGISGTNAHVILADPPPTLLPVASREEARPSATFLLSGMTAGALRDSARNAAAFLENPELTESDYDIAFTSCVRRDHHAHRLAALGATRKEWAAALRAFFAGDASGVVTAEVVAGSHRVAFICADVSADAEERLLRVVAGSTETRVFLDEAWEIARSRFGVALPARGEAAALAIDPRDEAAAVGLHLLHFAVVVELVRHWERAGLTPDVLVGVGVGEVAAAYAAGAAALEDAINLLVARARAVGAAGASTERARPSSTFVSQVIGALGAGSTRRFDVLSPTGEGWELDAATVTRLLSPVVVETNIATTLRDRGYTTLLELSPLRSKTLPEAILTTFDSSGVDRTIRSLLEAHCRGAQVVWSRYYTERGRVVALPSYPWQRAHIDIAGAGSRSSELVVLSAKGPGALDESAARLRAHLEAHPELGVGDVAYSLATGRPHHESRWALAVRSREELLEGLRSTAPGTLPSGAVREDVQSGKVAFLFTGQGAQTLGMGRELHAEWPVFRDALEAAWAALDAHLPKKLRDVMWAEAGSAEASLLHQTEFTQPALFAFEVALAALWRSWGVRPDYLTGHSIGELAAAHVGGVFSLADAARLVVARGRLMQSLPAGGAMLAVAAAEAVVSEVLAKHAGVSIAAINGPASVVISGLESSVQEIAAHLLERGVRTKRLEVSHAFHSSLMDPMLHEFRLVAESVSYRAPEIPVVSNVTGALVSEELVRPEYWVKHVREAVRFSDGVVVLHGAGARKFVEIGPKATLLGMVPACLPQSAQPQMWLIPTVSKGKPEPVAALAALGTLYALGAPLDWAGVFPGGGRHVELPTYGQRMLEASGSRSGEATGHPLLGVRVPAAGSVALYESVLSRFEEAWLYDHQIAGKALLPGMGLAELMRAAGERYFAAAATEVRDVVFRVPLVLPERGGLRVQVLLESEEGRAAASVYSQQASAGVDDKWTLHATANVCPATDAPSAPLDWSEIVRRCSDAIDVDAMYEAATEAGYEYGPAFRCVRRGARGDGEVFAEVALTTGVEEAERYGVHPSLLDAALHAALRLGKGGLVLPFAVERMTIHQHGVSAAKVHAIRAARPDASGSVALTVTLADEDGRTIAEVRGLQMRAVDVESFSREQAKDDASSLYRLDWPVAGQSSAQPVGGRWVVVASPADDVAHVVAARLSEAGASCRLVETAQLEQALPADHVVCVWSGSPSGDDIAAAMQAANDGLRVVRTVTKASKPPRLWWVTAGAMAVMPGDSVAPAVTTVWGLGRTVMQEHPELACTLVDVEAQAAGAEQALREFALHDDGEREIAWRAGERRVARLMRAPAPRVPAVENYALECSQKGSFDRLSLVPTRRRAPDPHEVEIAVRATGLNFRDVLNALGMYPGEDPPIGIELSGVVVAVGARVERLSVGDRVMALAAGSFRRFVTVDARLVAPMPVGVTFEEAAGIPAVFLTAWFGLKHLANLRPGERILVHAAAGGVGIAAVQIAQWLGATVFGTASAPKWDVVRKLGVEYVANSRDLSFFEAFREATKGEGLDVVLNSLTGESIDKSAALLREGGRFLEMGKTEIRDVDAMAKAYPGTTYSVFDLFDTAGPDRIEQMFLELAVGFASGALRPVPVRSSPITEAESVFRFMAQGRHVGKLVLLPPRELRADGTVLVTGGLGELGVLVARSLAKRGVKHLVLTGRRGLETPGANEAVSELQALGAKVTVAAVNVADEKELGQVISAIGDDMPLRGVVHAAGVLDDGMIGDQTPARFARVMLPKVAGATLLDRLTRQADLDIFVMFSSITGTLGNAGQSGYAAANAFVDGLAARRAQAGLVGQSLAWGLWITESEGAGMASRLNQAQRARLSGSGFGALSPSAGIALFEAALGRSEAQLAPVPVDFKALRARLGTEVPPIWRALIKAAPRAAKLSGGAWARDLAALGPERRAEVILEAVRADVARILSLSGAVVAPADKPLKELGLDSLMAIELRNALGKRVGVTLPATLVFDYPTPGAITKYLLEHVFASVTVAATTPSVRRAVRAAEEPIAIVGIGCRFPGGVSDPESYWRLLENGIDAVTEIPPERWDIDSWYDPDVDAVGKMVTRWGGFLNTREIEQFDPAFFGISPPEATSIDPQERLLLETTWEALERAGISANELMGANAGVYMGLVHNEYQARALRDPSAIDAYSFLGAAHSAVVGRISYWLGLRGPNMAVDTACSSSLVSVHLACQALWQGEISLALAGGANTILDPALTVYFSRLRALSPTGRCHAFSSDANGYVRSEGAGALVLERLSDARKNGHRVLSVIRGSAVNQDGRSNGLTAPNGPSQEAVIRAALERGQVPPASVGYLECHGTGTALGDPIEVQAAAAVLGEGRSGEHPLVLSSAKSNIGHTEGAAGVAGLIKAVLSLQHARIPKTLHVRALNPHIPWTELSVHVATESVEWVARKGEPRRAGVSSFGFSGTNAHIVIEEAPQASSQRSASPVRAAELVVLSAKGPGALEESGARLRAHLEAHPELGVGDVAYSLATGRTHHESRWALAVRSRDELLEGLRSTAPGTLPSGAVREDVQSGKVAFLFTGQGAQTLGMGRELHAEWPVFRDALEGAWAALDAHLPRKLREVMWAEAGSADALLLHQTAYTQPALFAFEVALAALWRSWGVRPDYLAGHSIGEVAAAHVAGVFSLADSARLVVARGRLMQSLPPGGAMMAVAAPEAGVADALAEHAGVSIAAINGRASVVISGLESTLQAVEALFSERRVRTKRLEVSHAFHSALMDPMLDEFRQVAESVSYRAPEIPVVSNVTGALVSEELVRPEYWVKHVREAVRFSDGVVALHDADARKFVEIGPKATLLGMVPACLPPSAQEQLWLIPTVSKGKPEPVGALTALGKLHALGAPVDWAGVFPDGGRHVELPTYAWQRTRHWLEASGPRSGEATGHPLLGVRVPAAGSVALYESVLSRLEEAWLYDHQIAGKALLPGAGLAELMRAAGECYFETAGLELSGVVFRVPLVLPERGGLRVQVLLESEGEGAQATVYSQSASGKAAEKWTLHATAHVHHATDTAGESLDWAAVAYRCREAVDVEQMYATAFAAGLEYGPAFRGLRHLTRGDGEALGEVELPAAVEGHDRYGVHPALLDAAFHAALGLSEDGALALPFAIDRVTVHQPGASTARVHAKRTADAASSGFRVDVTLADEKGRIVAEVRGLQARVVDGESFGREQAQDVSNHLYRVEWPIAAAPSSPAATLAGRWVVVASLADGLAKAVAARVAAAGASCSLVQPGRLGEALPADHIVCVWSGASGNRAEEALRVSREGLAVVQTLAKGSKPPRLWWVTTGAVAAIPSDRVEPVQASVWGLGRVVMNEHPELGCTLVDVEAGSVGSEQVLRELGIADEGEIAWRSAERRVARLVRAPSGRLPTGENYSLAIGQRGSFDRLELVAALRRAPGAGEVEIAVRASGLNFRDVVMALGMSVRQDGPIGSECAGIVVAVGPGIERFAIGDRVMAFAPGSFQRFVTTDARLVASVPPEWTFDEAAGVPAAFLTAWFALHDLAKLKGNERVLVHAAAGGVGMAAVQVAHWLGAKVFGTASATKWDTVRRLGVAEIASSRDLSFVDAFREATNGEGVDVVLNALTGEFIDKSASLLRTGGRFLEMGKVEIRDAEAMADKFPGTSYRAFDVGSQAGLERTAEMFRELAEGFASGDLAPLPVRSFPITEAEATFRFMAQGRHVGKIVMTPPRELRTDGTVLVTGGFGALGLLVARSLATRGVKHLVLTGRRGLDTPGARAAVSELEGLGAKVTAAAVDVADSGALAEVLSAIASDTPLRGVVHAAGVLDDGVLAEQTPERFARVMSPKVAGACNLDALTREEDLDIFVLFSSAAATVGNAGQGAYAAANMFLDGLAARRQEEGLVGQSLAWGLWVGEGDASAGLAASLNEAQRARLGVTGMGGLSATEGIALFEAALGRSEAQLVPLAVDINALRKRVGDDVPPLWRALIKGRQRVRKGKSGAWGRELAALGPERRAEAILDVVRTEIARVLSLSSADANPVDRPLKEVGLDSLMAIELRNALGKRAGVTLPATLAFDYPTPAAITKYLLENVFSNATVSETTATPQTVAFPSDEPIAIVGIGCRFPGGVVDLESFWRVLDEGVDAISEVPKDRWNIDEFYDPDPEKPGKMTTRWGGFLDGLEAFDPKFFGLTAHEAPSIDPQERLMLETSWEALENARIAPHALMGSDTGVYMGVCGTEYQARLMRDVENINAYTLLGSIHSAMVGRISYWLGLKGPNVAIDTACSSALVAVHVACQALRSGECSVALAGGASVMLDPSGTIYFSRLGAMSPTGRCHTFSAGADGYVRAEGAGVMVLKRLSAAQRDGDRVLAIIGGSAVNQDGRSNGMTAPNGPSQTAVIREALRRGGIAPADVTYLECHGTGTSLGDPIEVQAAAEALGVDRSADNPLVLGSGKTNFGHPEGAAGIGGLIKSVLTIRQGRIPKVLHFDTPSPHIPWSDLPVKVATEALDWPQNGKPRIAGTSSFGFSGTNAHVVIAEAPVTAPRRAAPTRAVELVVLSAKTAAALDAAAGRLASHLDTHRDVSLGDLAYSLATTRTHHEHRLALAVTSREVLRDALHAASRGESHTSSARGVPARGKNAWLFTGQGAQILGMGKGLYEAWPLFRAALDRACAALDPHLPEPLRNVMWGTDAARLDETSWTQPALFALEWALAALWQSWGVTPSVLAGHSIGEVVAACVAGVFSLEDAASLVAARARLMQALPRGGAMIAIGASEEEVASSLSPYGDKASLGAVNALDSVVVSGDEDVVVQIAEQFAARGTRTRRLVVSHAFHSSRMDPMLAEFQRVAERLTYHPPAIPIVSNVTGARAGAELATPAYWVRHVRETVRFARGIQTMHADGVRTFLELGPKPTLLGTIASCIEEADNLTLLSSLRTDRPESEAMVLALGGLYAQSRSLDWNALFPEGGRRVDLPSYPWQRQRYWVEARHAAAHARETLLTTSSSWPVEALPETGGPALNTWLPPPEETAWTTVPLDGSASVAHGRQRRRSSFDDRARLGTRRPEGPVAGLRRGRGGILLTSSSFVAQLSVAPTSERSRSVMGLLVSQLKQSVLDLDFEDESVQGRSLQAGGLDSLGATEVRRLLRAQGIEVPAAVLLSGVSLRSLAHDIVDAVDAPVSDAASVFEPERDELSYSLAITPEDLAAVRALRAGVYSAKLGVTGVWAGDDERDGASHVFMAKLEGRVIASWRALPIASRLSELESWGQLPKELLVDPGLCELGRLAADFSDPRGLAAGTKLMHWAAEWLLASTLLRRYVGFCQKRLVRLYHQLGGEVRTGTFQIPERGQQPYFFISGDLAEASRRLKTLG